MSAKREITTLSKHLEIWEQYGENEHPKTASEKLLLDTAVKYLNELKTSGGGITPKKMDSRQKPPNRPQEFAIRKNEVHA